ncbi:SRPBCC family protein [Candidatus Thiothrix anitrata]|uniref:SRPBCC family protein n=1 Tax=Candidatus Thiothrix anitrata TaxID=2823902 RepID=A0ABX7X1N6_9GAMM|nr:SRPBCC family protein [Candidatus Thiothrix anitrata]QTR48528.1 SRPBCC family protein [Candidatus Thiothrix anitrata]
MLGMLLGALVLLLLLALLIGILLPAREQVTRVELFKAPVAEVWEALSNLPGQAQWRSGLKSVQTLDDDEGLRWVEQPQQGAASILRKTKEIPLQELILEARQSGVLTTRQARLSNVPGGTRVTFTQTLQIAMPLRRLGNRMQGGVDNRLDNFIRQLRTKFST